MFEGEGLEFVGEFAALGYGALGGFVEGGGIFGGG